MICGGLLLLNTRCPELMDGDLKAMIGSTRIGAERLAAIAATLGTERCKAYFDAALDYGEKRMRAAVATLPAGDYFAEDVSDTDCFETRDVAVRLKLTVTTDALVFDFTGTDPQILGFKNSSYQNTCSAVYLATSTFFDYEIPRNEGTYRAVKVIAPAGTVVNALAPAPMTMCTVFPAQDIINACWRALALADPDRGCGSWGKNTSCSTSAPSETGEPFILYHWNGSPAAGAVRERDGFNTMGQMTTLGGTMLPNVENWERLFPIQIGKVEFRQDAGGPGRRRGGTGVDYVVDIKAPAEYSFRAEGGRKPTGLGVAGGKDGAAGALVIKLPGKGFQAPPQYDVQRLPSLTLQILSPGGGGFGPPRERDPASVLRDVEDEIVSLHAASSIYGVVIDAATMTVDIDATRMLRKEPGIRQKDPTPAA